MLSAEIFAIGSELLTGRFPDTNSLYLTDQLELLGIPVSMKTVVGDDEDAIEQSVRAALTRTPLLIATGGLGPTEDDLTRKVFARILQRQLVLNDEVLARIESRFKARGITMPRNNARQALIPVGAQILENRNGTAPGLWLTTDANQLLLLPGPPSELKPMFEELCVPRLRQLSGESVIRRRMYRTTGIGESSLDARISPIYGRCKNPEVTILAKLGQVDVHLTARAKTEEEAERLLAEVGDPIDKELEKYIFARGDQSLEEIVGLYLVMKRATISVAESCTGGMLAERLTRISGSSQYFMSGMILYSNQSKIAFAGIPPLLIQMQGAVSAEVASGLAESVRERMESTIGVGITGIAGPTGGSPEKPVGTVHIAVAGPSGTAHRHFVFLGDRDKIRWQSTQAALDMIRRVLLKM